MKLVQVISWHERSLQDRKIQSNMYVELAQQASPRVLFGIPYVNKANTQLAIDPSSSLDNHQHD
jgi:hypothetical protein